MAASTPVLAHQHSEIGCRPPLPLTGSIHVRYVDLLPDLLHIAKNFLDCPVLSTVPVRSIRSRGLDHVGGCAISGNDIIIRVVPSSHSLPFTV